MEQNERLKKGLSVIYLAACALHGKAPKQEMVMDMELSDVYQTAHRHSMQAIAYMGLAGVLPKMEAGLLNVEVSLLEEWKGSVAHSMKQAVLYDLESEKIRDFFESKGIWYAPLRGSVLQNDYPKLGMRQMADNDILFDPTRREELRDFMVQSGYRIGFFNREYPDSYIKNGIMFDMHFELFMNTAGQKKLFDYYGNVKERLLPTEGTNCGYHFRQEDFYVYVIAHAYKHFSSGGNGLRSLMDLYVYNERNGKDLDWNYVNGELEKLGLLQYEQQAKALSQKLFSARGLEMLESQPSWESVLTEEEGMLLGVHVVSGTYGTTALRSQNELDALLERENVSFLAKVKFCFVRLFPRPEYFRINYPRIYKTKVLIPFAVLWRILTRMILQPKKRINELKMVIRKKK